MQNKISAKLWLGIIGFTVITGIVTISIFDDADADNNLSSVTERVLTMQEWSIDEVPVSSESATEGSTSSPIVELPVTESEESDAAPVPTTNVSSPVVIAPTPAPEPAPEPEPEVVGITKAEVANHAGEASCWTIVNGSVYDITSYVPRHPGGKKQILAICGRDGTFLFEGQHGGESKPESILAGFYLDVVSP